MKEFWKKVSGFVAVVLVTMFVLAILTSPALLVVGWMRLNDEMPGNGHGRVEASVPYHDGEGWVNPKDDDDYPK